MADDVEIFVCVTCAPRAEDTAIPKPGAVLARLLNARLAELGAADIKVREVECLAVCKRPSTIAMTAAGKWTYIIGDLFADKLVQKSRFPGIRPPDQADITAAEFG